MKRNDLFQKFLRVHPVIRWAVLIMLVLILVLSLDLLTNFFTAEASLNIAKGQLIVELLGLMALVIAIMEFIEVSKKPKLRLWIESIDENNLRHLSQYKIEAIQSSNIYKTHPGMVDQPIIDLVRYSFRFKVFIENYGEKVARFVKVTIRLDGRDTSALKEPIFPRVSRIPGQWLVDGFESRAQGLFHSFYGAEDFVVYSHPLDAQNINEWITELAEFMVDVPKPPLDKSVDLKLICTIQADEFDLKIQTIEFPTLRNNWQS